MRFRTCKQIPAKSLGASWFSTLARRKARDAVRGTLLVLATSFTIPSGQALAQSAQSAGSASDGYWIGNPTPFDYIGKNAGGALADAASLGVAGPKVEAQISQARARFFAPGLTAAQKQAAGREFGQVLWDKEMLYAALYLPEGFNKHAEAAVAVIAKLSHPGAQGIPAFLDGGFPGMSWHYFIIWIRAVRATMGAPEDGQLLLIMDHAAVMKAMLANKDSYMAYRVERDKGEFEEWANRQKPRVKVAPVGDPQLGAKRTAQECKDEGQALNVVSYLRQKHLRSCMAGYRFTSAEQVQAIANQELLEVGRQINARRR